MRRRDDDDEFDDDDDFDIVKRRGTRRGRDGGDAASRAFAPALALIIVSLISFAFLFVYCPFNLIVVLNDPNHQRKPEAEKAGAIFGAGVCVPLMALSSLGVAICGYLMLSRASYGAAMTGAIIACVPCLSPCCVIGIPFGIWALFVLNDPEVREWFRASR